MMFSKEVFQNLSEFCDNSTCASSEASSPKGFELESSFEKPVILGMLNIAKFPVFLASLPSANEQFALKMFPYVEDEPDFCFYNEIQFANLKHENVISILHYEVESDADLDDCTTTVSYTLMEYAPHGDFHDLLSSKEVPADEKLARTYFRQLIEGLEYLHSKGISHLDLKPDNLLLGKNYILKIADFDQAYSKGQDKIYSRGTECFRAPEIKIGACQDPEAADIYSAGLMLFILKSVGTLPYFERKKFEGIDLFELLMSKPKLFWKKHCEIQGQSSSFYDEDFKELFTSMVALLPEERASLKQIKKSNWYNGPVYSQEELVIIMQKVFKNDVDL